MTFQLVATVNAQTTVIISAQQAEELQAFAGEDADAEPGEQITLGEIPAATGGTEPYRYSWILNDEVVSSETNPVVEVPGTSSYTLLVRDNATCSVKDTVTLTVSVTGIGSINMDMVRIYPNPASHEIHFEYLEGECELSLFDELGREYWTKSVSGNALLQLPEQDGIYWLRIASHGKTAYRKFIISK